MFALHLQSYTAFQQYCTGSFTYFHESYNLVLILSSIRFSEQMNKYCLDLKQGNFEILEDSNYHFLVGCLLDF